MNLPKIENNIDIEKIVTFQVKLLDIAGSLLRPGRKLFTNVQNSWKYEQLNKDRWKEMCKKLGFKKVKPK